MEPITAKQFLIARVIEEAQAEQVHLTAVEIKMLYFTEAQPMTPDMVQAVTEFEGRDLSEEYEDKIVALLKSARNRDLAQSQSYSEMWTEAVAGPGARRSLHPRDGLFGFSRAPQVLTSHSPSARLRYLCRYRNCGGSSDHRDLSIETPAS